MPPGVGRFVENTLKIALDPRPHVVAAAFTYGREDVIPDMFKRVIARLSGSSGRRGETESLVNGTASPNSTLLYYLERHVQCDGEEHGPLAQKLVSKLCGDDANLWNEAELAARSSLAARVALWDSVASSIERRRDTKPTRATPAGPSVIEAPRYR